MTSDGTVERQLAKLRKDLGEVFLAALAHSDTVEVVLNADGTIWHERLGEPLQAIGTMSAPCADAAMRTIAAYHHATLTRDNPSIECEFPLDGSRFAGQIPPIVTAPVFAVRKRASRVFTLGQYVKAGIMTPEQKEFLCGAIRDHRNILAIGGTGSGKAQPIDAKVLTPTGWRCMGDLAVSESCDVPGRNGCSHSRCLPPGMQVDVSDYFLRWTIRRMLWRSSLEGLASKARLGGPSSLRDSGFALSSVAGC